MNWLADESVDGPIVAKLRANGLVVPYVAEMSPGITDDEVLAEASRLDAILLTADKDFGELIYRLHRANAGVVLLRLSGMALDAKAEIVLKTIQEHEAQMRGAFTVIGPTSVRIRAGD